MRPNCMIGCVHAGVFRSNDVVGTLDGIRAGGLLVAVFLFVARHVVMTSVVYVRGKRKFESNAKLMYRGFEEGLRI